MLGCYQIDEEQPAVGKLAREVVQAKRVVQETLG